MCQCYNIYMDKADIFLDHFYTILSPRVLWIVFALGLGILIMMSLAFMYHWKEYALAHHVKNVLAQKVYLSVTAIMTLVSLGLLISYTFLV